MPSRIRLSSIRATTGLRILERDLVGALEREDLARLVGRGDLEPQPFEDLARHADLVGIGGGELALADPQRVLEADPDRKSTRLNSSHSQISYAVFCLKKKKKKKKIYFTKKKKRKKKNILQKRKNT